jgi:hypothetical protein
LPCQPCIVEDGIDAINRATEIMGFHLNRQSTEGAHVAIEPAVSQFEWTDFLNYEELIREGEKAADSKIEEIRSLLEHGFRRKVFRWVREIIPRMRKEVDKRALPDSVLEWFRSPPAPAERGVDRLWMALRSDKRRTARTLPRKAIGHVDGSSRLCGSI